MDIQLPEDISLRLQQWIRPGVSEVDVIRKSLDALERLDTERRAIQEGIDAMREGRVRSAEDFDREFRKRKRIGVAH